MQVHFRQAYSGKKNSGVKSSNADLTEINESSKQSIHKMLAHTTKLPLGFLKGIPDDHKF